MPKNLFGSRNGRVEEDGRIRKLSFADLVPTLPAHCLEEGLRFVSNLSGDLVKKSREGESFDADDPEGQASLP